MGVENGVVGNIPVSYPDISKTEESIVHDVQPEIDVKKKGCAK